MEIQRFGNTVRKLTTQRTDRKSLTIMLIQLGAAVFVFFLAPALHKSKCINEASQPNEIVRTCSAGVASWCEQR
jgi:hypothetical protein